MSKVAVVTGAGSGIGRASAFALAAHGYRLVLAGRRAEPIEETAAQAGAEAIAIPCDVTDEDQVAGLFDRAVDRFGRIDLLFNNAGAFGGGLFDEIPLATWRQMIDVNLTGYFICAQAAFRRMRRQNPQGGRIINNGSVSAQSPRPHSAPYAAAKHGVTGLTKAIALDGRPFGISCGQIDIGNAATPLSRRFEEGALQPDGSVRPEPTFDVARAAEAVAYMANLPADANVPAMTVMATAMPMIGRG